MKHIQLDRRWFKDEPGFHLIDEAIEIIVTNLLEVNFAIDDIVKLLNTTDDKYQWGGHSGEYWIRKIGSTVQYEFEFTRERK